MKSEVVLYGVKQSAGNFEGTAFSSTTFHLTVDLTENGAGKSLGVVTRPFKLGDAHEFDKWAHLGASLPIRCMATFEVSAAREDGTKLVLKALAPVVQDARKAA